MDTRQAAQRWAAVWERGWPEGVPVVATDLSADLHRVRLISQGRSDNKLEFGQLEVTSSARSEAGRHILADLTGRQVAIADPDAGEATARSAVVQAAAVLTGTGVRELRRAWAPRTEVVATPRRGTAELREQLLERYLTVTDRTGFDGRAQR